LSFVYKVVEDLVDDVLDKVKQGLDDYADTVTRDVERFVDRMLRRAVKEIALGVVGAALVSAGLIFSLVGMVTYLSSLVSPAFAWGIVGLGMIGLGAVLVLPLLRRGSRGMQHATRLHEGNGNGN
jgi:hypothetical protein